MLTGVIGRSRQTSVVRRYSTDVNRREKWRQVLASEVERWSAKPWAQLVAELSDVQAYELEFDSKAYQVEVELLENTAEHIHVMVAVDDGSLPASISPVSDGFILEKTLS